MLQPCKFLWRRPDPYEFSALFTLIQKAVAAEDYSLLAETIAGQIEACMIDMHLSGINKHLLVTYDTKWVPNQNDMIRIAAKFNVTMMHDCEEPDTSLHGKSVFTPGKRPQQAELDESDLMRISFDEQTGLYSYKGESSICHGAIADQILHEKIRKIPLLDT